MKVLISFFCFGLLLGSTLHAREEHPGVKDSFNFYCTVRELHGYINAASFSPSFQKADLNEGDNYAILLRDSNSEAFAINAKLTGSKITFELQHVTLSNGMVGDIKQIIKFYRKRAEMSLPEDNITVTCDGE